MLIHNNAVITLTNKCTASCSSCCLDCSPTKNTHLNLETVLSTIDGLNKLGIKTLLLSGGETFLYYNEILQILQQAKMYKMLCSLNTNAFWCTSMNITIDKLRELRRSGLTNVITSIDIYHQEYISISNVKNLLYAAKETGVRPLLNLCGGYKDADDGIISLLKQMGDAIHFVDIRYFPLSIVGAAKRNLSKVNLDHTYRADDLKCQAYQTIHIQPDGSVCTCCGDLNNKEPFIIGNIYENTIESIMKQSRKCPAYYLVITKGFKWIKEKLVNMIPELAENKFNNSCEFCEKVFCQESSKNNIDLLMKFIENERLNNL